MLLLRCDHCGATHETGPWEVRLPDAWLFRETPTGWLHGCHAGCAAALERSRGLGSGYLGAWMTAGEVAERTKVAGTKVR